MWHGMRQRPNRRRRSLGLQQQPGASLQFDCVDRLRSRNWQQTIMRNKKASRLGGAPPGHMQLAARPLPRISLRAALMAPHALLAPGLPHSRRVFASMVTIDFCCMQPRCNDEV